MYISRGCQLFELFPVKVTIKKHCKSGGRIDIFLRRYPQQGGQFWPLSGARLCQGNWQVLSVFLKNQIKKNYWIYKFAR